MITQYMTEHIRSHFDLKCHLYLIIKGINSTVMLTVRKRVHILDKEIKTINIIKNEFHGNDWGYHCSISTNY